MTDQHDRIVEKDLHEIPANRRILDVRPWHVKAREWLSFKENYAFAIVICTLFPLTFPVLTLPALATIIILTVVNRSIRAVMPLRYPAGSFDVVVDKKGKESRPVPGTSC